MTVCLVAMLPPAQAQTRMPWTFPGDFRDRLLTSDLVVSGIHLRLEFKPSIMSTLSAMLLVFE